jgi:hypothetical protein
MAAIKNAVFRVVLATRSSQVKTNQEIRIAAIKRIGFTG